MRYTFWAEGFAEYCAYRYFADLYPEDYKVQNPILRNNMLAINKIEKVLRSSDDSFELLDIPREWQFIDFLFS